MKDLTGRQQKALDAIRDHILAYGFPPTSAELAKVLGISQTGAVGYIRVLERYGRIKTTPNISRSIVLL